MAAKRFLTWLGVIAAPLLTAFAAATAVGHAAAGDVYQTCDGGVCLTFDQDNLADWHYTGIRPFFTNWEGDQSYLVQVAQDDGTTLDAGSYMIKILDSWNPFMAVSTYEYGDFVPNGDISGLDLGWWDDLAGATVRDANWFNGMFHQLTLYDIGPHGMNYNVMTFGDFTATVVTANDMDNASAMFYQVGDSDPVFLWNALFHSWLPDIPDQFIPADPFAGIDFDPGDFGLDVGAV